ncbi:putative glycolipid-binding domain-containing protein [Rhizobium sp. 18055]|uniref:putative glycolipid-binding domain-containing protein n=1 Tax=Rhizobium sp. 18055 TaxID=2681403 RepID=UPI0013574E6C|nr:putative glycolipid-binding domain-containing protein [Rhizobium sp. 18055]
MTALKRVARWTDWNGAGIEHLSVLENASWIHAEGVVIGQLNENEFGLSYQLHLDLDWRVREVRIQIANSATLHIWSDGRGRWVRGDGTEIGNLAGCVDVDIAATPFTNTLPIRRLKLKTGQTETIKVAYVSVPELSVEPVKQRYTRLAETRFLYEGISTSFSAELEVDDVGMVLDYPGAFRRLPPA